MRLDSTALIDYTVHGVIFIFFVKGRKCLIRSGYLLLKLVPVRYSDQRLGG